MSRPIRALALALALAACAIGHGAEVPIPAAARRLHAAAQSASGDRQKELTIVATKLLLLAEHDRLLPADLSPERLNELHALLFNPTTDERARDEASKLPSADRLAFDGQRLAGGNFGYIDTVIGMGGRPIALDRQIPTLLVPLSRDSSAALLARGDRLATSTSARHLRARVDRFHTGAVSHWLAEDGIFVRDYAGLLDDLYFHLVQEGSPLAQLQFYAVIDALPERSYHPIAGLGGEAAIPPVWFSASDLLSAGALEAVRRYPTKPGTPRRRNSFIGISSRIIPFLDTCLAHWLPGSELRVDRTVFAKAIRTSHRFTPAAVPPLFHDPARFLGAHTPRLTRVRNATAKTRAEIEEEAELPEKTSDPAANGALTEGLPYWEDPTVENAPVLSPSRAVSKAAPRRKAVPPKLKEQIAAEPSRDTFQVAVLTPTIDEAETYVQNIAENEKQLSANARALNRVGCYLRWMVEAQSALGRGGNVEDQGDLTLLDLRLAVERDTQLLRNRAEHLRRDRLEQLQTRAALREPLERALREQRDRLLEAAKDAPIPL